MTSPARGAAPTPGEHVLIDHIRRRLPPAPPSLIVGPGDDAAVIAPARGAFQVFTVDAVVEGVHFDRRFSSLADVGYKALAVNMSDLAAMGAQPEFALLSLLLPDGTSLGDVDALLDGLLEMAAAAGAALIGGNISKSPGPLVVDVTATGSVRPRRLLTRAGGRPGDQLFVTGSIGAAAAGLGWLKASEGGPAPSPLPIDPSAAGWWASRGQDPVLASVSGGDDYELLFAVPKKIRGRLRSVARSARGLPFTRIGELTAQPEVVLRRNGVDEPLPAGFQHF